MFTRWSESVRESFRAAVYLTALLGTAVASPASARLLFLEDPLRSITPLEQDRTRLEFGSEYFGARGWTGLRNALRYDGSKGPLLVYSVTVPWLYSSYFDRGETGQGDLRGGLSVNHPGLPRGALCLAGEIWLPVSEDRLYPLQQRRTFARLSLLGARSMAGLAWRGSLSYRWELPGVGPETTGGPWPRRFAANLRALRRFDERWALFVEGGLWVSPEAASWSRSGAGIRLRWAELWTMELMGETAQGAQGDRDLYDYRISLRFAREMLRPASEAPGQGGQTPAEPEGQLPPGQGGQVPPEKGSQAP